MVVVCRHISGELPSKPRCCFSASSFLLGRVCGMRAPYGNGCIFATWRLESEMWGGWEQGLEPYQVFRGLVHLPDPHIISLKTWFQNSQIFENSNTEFEICCFLLKSQTVFHFWYLFLRVYMCPCAHMHSPHPTQYDLFSESPFFLVNHKCSYPLHF